MNKFHAQNTTIFVKDIKFLSTSIFNLIYRVIHGCYSFNSLAEVCDGHMKRANII